ncbi:MAG: PilZ domain-containing protein [Acidobacteria bacterium]|nr:PilZ domain-containing protein [Acidobacteriota bacterium]
MSADLVPRAERFVVELPVRYRVAGQEDWSYGLTRNISTSGLLFNALKPLGVDTPVEFEVSVPRPFAGHDHARLNCTGLIVRGTKELDDTSSLAATISTYQLLPHDDSLAASHER